ncbi:Uridine kinase OS=Bosea thiooxidans OX=53254 GN=SAMN05660750_01656 PE=4 SV=1 [Bosea thiooxidans]|uniref:Uridine kinase n=2 Tax=Bosea thiooxidans TaxID=53254 RepID=A0A1T5CU13_9HYPH|nr:uridine kinase [Bosea thiooxidans]
MTWDMSSRLLQMEHLAERLAGLPARALVAIDGVDGAGKSTFRDALAPMMERRGASVVRASVDGFHNPRAIRYARGKADPGGFFQDSYDYRALRQYLLEPFRNGATKVQTARFDHRADCEAIASQQVAPSAILLIDGIFLHRDELYALWDFSVFLNVPFEVSYRRMSQRDGCSADPLAIENRRYYEGQRLYLGSCQPQLRATVSIDNFD